MRVCLVYDCLYPYTVGGAERWYRHLGERLARDGHEVTYLTLLQWEGEAEVAGVDVVAVGPQLQLYTKGRRRFWPPLRFGLGVLWHLLRHGRRYDVIHTAATPFFGLLAAALLRPLYRYRLVVDWHEVWTRDYWREYLGRVGDLGWRVQQLAIHVPHHAFCFAHLHARRLLEEGYRGQPTVLEGEYVGDTARPETINAAPLIVFAGRFIPEKQVPALVRAFPLVLERAPGLKLALYGDGPERALVKDLISELDLDGQVDAPGFVNRERVEADLRMATAMVLPSRREGYGLVVVEALAKGTPVVVIAGADNAAVELVKDGINGFVAPSPSPVDLASAIVRVVEAGEALRVSTADWYEANSRRLSLEGSLETVLVAYREGR